VVGLDAPPLSQINLSNNLCMWMKNTQHVHSHTLLAMHRHIR
jgi:hypothetical protein